MRADQGQIQKRHPSLVLRLVRSSALWTLPILGICAAILIWLYQSSTLRLFDDPLESAVTSLIANVQTEVPVQIDPDGREDSFALNESLDKSPDKNSEPLSLIIEPVDPRYQRALSGRYWLIGFLKATGEIDVLKTSRSLSGEALQLSPDVSDHIMTHLGEDIRAYADGPDENETLRLVARSVIFPNMNERPVVIIAAADRRPARKAIRRFGYIATALLSLLSLGLVIGIYTQVRVGLKPIFDLRDEVIGVREGLRTDVAGDYPSEIQPLARELNTLIAHNRDVVDRARTHVGNLAHALKTPLAVLVNESDRAKTNKKTSKLFKKSANGTETLAEIVGRQSDIMKNQVDHHLQRARAAARGQMIGAVTSVSDVVEPMERTLARIYGNRDIDFDIGLQEGVVFRGEKRDLDELIGNLMDNACKWCKSTVRVRAHLLQEDNTRLRITVEDDGKGLTDAQYEQAIQRGIRLDETKPGTGFGLSIVGDLAKAYKGEFVLKKSDLGGLSAEITLPGRLGLPQS